jgi:hypothetical protein
MKGNKDYSGLIIWSALLVTVARYVGAFLASDLGKVDGVISEILTVLMGLSGLGMGFLDVLGLAYVFDGWRKALPKGGERWTNRFLVLTAFVIGLFVAGVSILVPFTVARVRDASMFEVLGHNDWWWAFAVNIAPYLLIGGVTFSQTGIVTVKHGENTTLSKEDASIEKMAIFKCKQCEETFPNVQELANHTRWKHPKHKNGKVIERITETVPSTTIVSTDETKN